MLNIRLALVSALILGSTMVACGGGSSGGGSQPALPSVTLQASPPTISVGTSTSLAWSSTNASACTASGPGRAPGARRGLNPRDPLENSSTYTLACTGPGGANSASVTVEVTSADAPAVSLTADPVSVPGRRHFLARLECRRTHVYQPPCTACVDFRASRCRARDPGERRARRSRLRPAAPTPAPVETSNTVIRQRDTDV
jgi:hypothetical protein